MFLTKLQGCVCCQSVPDKETDESCSDKKSEDIICSLPRKSEDWTVIANNLALERDYESRVAAVTCQQSTRVKQPSSKVSKDQTQEKQVFVKTLSKNQDKLQKLLEPDEHETRVTALYCQQSTYVKQPLSSVPEDETQEEETFVETLSKDQDKLQKLLGRDEHKARVTSLHCQQSTYVKQPLSSVPEDETQEEETLVETLPKDQDEFQKLLELDEQETRVTAISYQQSTCIKQPLSSVPEDKTHEDQTFVETLSKDPDTLQNLSEQEEHGTRITALSYQQSVPENEIREDQTFVETLSKDLDTLQNLSEQEEHETRITELSYQQSVPENEFQEDQTFVETLSKDQDTLQKLSEPDNQLKTIDSSAENHLEEFIEDARLVESAQSEQKIKSEEFSEEVCVNNFDTVEENEIKKGQPSVEEDSIKIVEKEQQGETSEFSTESVILKEKHLSVEFSSELSGKTVLPLLNEDLSVTDATSNSFSECNLPQLLPLNQEISSETTNSLSKMSSKLSDNQIKCNENKQDMDNTPAFLNLDNLCDNSDKAKVDSTHESKTETNGATLHLPCDDIEKPISSLNECISLLTNLDSTLANKREESPASDELIDTLVYEPDEEEEEEEEENVETTTSSLEEAKSTVDSPTVEIKKESEEILNEVKLNNTELKPAPDVLPDSISSVPETIKNTDSSSKDDEKTGNSSSTVKKKNKKNKSTEDHSTGNQSVNHQNTVAVKSEKPTENISKPHSTKNKKKEDKTADHVLKSLSNIPTAEGKLSALSKKYTAMNEENRTLTTNQRVIERKLLVLSRQKDQLQLENNKSLMAKSRLESLCRELQKHNRIIKEESLARAKEEDEKRKEISSKFQTTINDIQAQMVDNHNRNMKLREENTELATKLKNFLEQYEQREKYFEKVAKHRELEQQLVDTKLKQAAMQLVEEREKSKKEKELMALKTVESESKMVMLETQVKTYKDRYSEFQSTITKSNDMFSKLKGEMDKMSGKIRKLEKDSAAWKNKWENCNKALIGMIDQKTSSDKERILLLTKIQKLESLCRAQQERLRAQKSPPPSTEATCQKCKNESIPTSQNVDSESTNQAANNDETAMTKNADSSETSPAADLEKATAQKNKAEISSHPSEEVSLSAQTPVATCSESSNACEASQHIETSDKENFSETEHSNNVESTSSGCNNVAEEVRQVETTALVS
ncbi:girdin isoform X1 [Octopus sinensis]|uniref:Girdin isoform X1 n=1 Tax=Octopus sinensis TaxID=2607531 RepID=A0A6P7S934_9MOLL|nr:girdin isoform X1 [Octopus sinensis]